MPQKNKRVLEPVQDLTLLFQCQFFVVNVYKINTLYKFVRIKR